MFVTVRSSLGKLSAGNRREQGTIELCCEVSLSSASIPTFISLIYVVVSVQVDVWVLGLERNKHGEEVLSLTMLGGPPLAMKDIRYDKVYEGMSGMFVLFSICIDKN